MKGILTKTVTKLIGFAVMVTVLAVVAFISMVWVVLLQSAKVI